MHFWKKNSQFLAVFRPVIFTNSQSYPHVKMEADYKKLLRFHNQEMKRMERELAKVHSETVTVRKYRGGVMDDLDKEHQAECSCTVKYHKKTLSN